MTEENKIICMTCHKTIYLREGISGVELCQCSAKQTIVSFIERAELEHSENVSSNVMEGPWLK